MNIIGGKQYKDYDRVSRYSVFPFYHHKIDDKYFYGITSHLDTEGTKFVAHKVVNGDTLDTLALYYYNNPTYFWVIADFNRIRDPYEELIEGEVLKIPTFSNIAFKL
jgi:nucleoid-associated protein YgaU